MRQVCDVNDMQTMEVAVCYLFRADKGPHRADDNAFVYVTSIGSLAAGERCHWASQMARQLPRLIIGIAVALGCLARSAIGAENSVSSPSGLLSANVLYREFQNNPVDAIARYVDRAVILEGRRGQTVLLSDGVGAAVHIADGGRPNALILSFPDRRQLKGIDSGAAFRFRCTVTQYEFGTVWMGDCSIEPSPGTPASTDNGTAERAAIVGGLLSANALYRAFESDADGASAKYVGQALVLEGLRGNVIRRSDGISAAVHIRDRFKENALVLSFSDRNQLTGIENGAKFRFRCTVQKFEYLIVWMDNCSIVSR
jgi:hypothetical protein